MEKSPSLRFSVSELIALTNQTLEYAYPSVEVEGEVSGFKINQNKYVFFDLKDGTSSVSCFMGLGQLRGVIEDGMKVIVVASPRLTKWGKFSLTVRTVRLSGEGSLKKGFELLKAKLEKEGLFASERKRTLPRLPSKVAVISSVQAAGYADFLKIVNDRWGGLQIEVAHVQVQGEKAPDQIVRALKYLNTRDDLPDVIVIIRGGGSIEDLSAFNDEVLVREIAASRVPTLVGVGHEVDVSLADMACDVRAATPSNAAQILVPDRRDVINDVRQKTKHLLARVEYSIESQQRSVQGSLMDALAAIERRYTQYDMQLSNLHHLIVELDPRRVLARGYALIRGAIKQGATIEIEKSDILITAEVKHVSKK